MDYGKIRYLVNAKKRAHQNEQMNTVSFGRFSIMWSAKTPAIIVDTDIAEKVCHRMWCIDSGGYPVTNCGGTLVRLFDYVMAQENDCKPKGYYVDHVNYDKLDNRRQNLRLVTPTESAHNMPRKVNNTSGVTGVSKTKQGTYRAYITANHKRIDLGRHNNIEDAISARRKAEERLGFLSRSIDIKAQKTGGRRQ